MLLNQKIPLSYLFKKVRKEVAVVTIVGLVSNYLTHAFKDYIPAMPVAIPTFIGTAISVLLSFKLNQSYDRWWEARKIWGSIVNDSRTFVLQLQSFLKPGNESAIKNISYRHIGWVYCLGQSLRGQDPMQNLDQYLSEKDMAVLQIHANKTLGILQLNTLDLARLKQKEQLDVFTHIQISTTLANFSDYMGVCERIKSTIFPVTYRRYLHWIIYLFTITLSISLRDLKIFYELPLLVAICTAFFLLEKSATHLQDPFSNLPTDTAMTTIARNIEINIKQLIGEKEIPGPLHPTEFYAL